MLEEEFTGLCRLDDGRLAELFQQNRGNIQFLDALNEVLKQRDSDEAIDLQIEVVKARRALPRPAMPSDEAVTPRQSGPVGDWLGAFLLSRRLARPDGRPLYRYRMADSEYEQAKRILRRLAGSGRLADPDRHSGAIFVSFGAEWFRRESVSTFLKWDALAPDIFPSVPYSSKQQLTLLGLKYWGRALRRSANAREFLLTLALEGGFPVQILAEGARGWLKDYLCSVMRRAIAWRVDAGDEILAIAEEERGRMRKSYQHDDFVALCSELVESLLLLRRKAEAESANGIRNSALLDAKHPGWQDELPIYVPAQDEALVTELLTGLLDEKLAGLSTVGVEARRYLVNRDGQWLPAAQLLADGEIPGSKLPGLSALGRARAIPTGELANYLTGDLALLEAPIGEQRHWRVRPFMRASKLLIGFRFTSPVTTTLTSMEGAPFHWTWPRGEALRSDVLVFQQDEGSTPKEPLLRFLRAGSVSSPAKTLYVLVPDDWTVEPTTENAVIEIEGIPGLDRKLVRLAGPTYFGSREGDSVRFKVEPDADGRERELEFASGLDAGFFLAEERWELVGAPVRPMIREGGKQARGPSIGELFIRRPGGKWAPFSGSLSGAGLMELSWRDPTTNVQIEKRLLALVPNGARVSGTMNDAISGQIRLEGLPGWSASVHEGSCSVDAADSADLSIRFTGRPVYHLPMSLRPPAGQPFDVIVPLVGNEAVVALANGSILTPGAQVDVGALRGAVAASPRRTYVHLGVKGFRSGGLRVVVDGELPLGILRSAIDEILATLPHQDDVVEFDFIGDTRRPIRISRYRYEQLTIDHGMVRWSPSDSSDASPVVRMILDPRYEHALEPEAHGLWRIPERCKGLCLVYLRDSVDVVSRPVPVSRPSTPATYTGDLALALVIPEYYGRQREIAKALLQLGQGEGQNDDLNWLLDAATNLNGLPPSAFDALKLLPSSPQTLIRLLLNARDAGERGAVWSLQNELPFLWLALPLSAWKTAVQSDYAAIMGALENVFGRERAASEALARLASIRDELIALEPALETTFSLVGLPAARATAMPSLRELTSGYIAGQYHRGGEALNDLAARLTSVGLKVPAEIETKSHTEFAGLFAPVLLAASAQKKLILERDLALLVRRSLREDPAYVAAAWCHLLKFYGSD
ncbi:STY4851/ECs_5259 family protein [Bradyrhizobium sp. SZCCHNS3004]|uniref:STY4851/ECs_5259 family protein n=1 Tax=Bradyrhizobium sp. SZCCHNS3004 TaxID=3057312 RepID=UPI002916E656|nr:STY4851/ECs_5259 family protein [Bradyrhizobium sp. SZCCHNS3004]